VGAQQLRQQQQQIRLQQHDSSSRSSWCSLAVACLC
jgi:hypothetical protein